MKMRRMENMRRVCLLRTKGLRVCLFLAVLAFAMASRPGEWTSFAQSPESPTGAQPAEGNAASGTKVQEASPDKPAKQEVNNAAVDPQKKQLADDSANLLRLANSLKAAVDKTTQDTLSIVVVRQAEEIEKLAHKMRKK
ncbi:MAG TPA: hypothetical protein VMW15_10865 [Terracidiphilus sp.]|nr:hypothetical protein [Terracidiphilus sp.]